MYVPGRFAETDSAAMQRFVAAHAFATLITAPLPPSGAAVPFASHLPLLLDPGRGAHGALRGHMARANPQWRHFAEGGEVLAIFSGPHAFVSSLWSAEPSAAVPTWNYVAVHVYGRARVLDSDAAALGVLAELMATFQPEGNPVPLDPPAPLAKKLVQAIVAFEIEVTRWEGKSKLSQNRTEEDRRRIEDALRAGSGIWDGDIAGRMQGLREPEHG
jgi:transcriptional regulator